MCIDTFGGTFIPWSSTTDKQLFAVLGKSKIPALLVKDTKINPHDVVVKGYQEFILYTLEARDTRHLEPKDAPGAPCIDGRDGEATKELFTPPE